MSDLRSKNIFNIGHSATSSETFLPQFIQDEHSDFVFGDLAGLHDTNGDMVELVLLLLNRKIFQNARTVRFLITISLVQMESNRGTDISQNLMKTIRSMLLNYTPPFSQSASSMLPVVTKVRPKLDENADKVLLSN